MLFRSGSNLEPAALDYNHKVIVISFSGSAALLKLLLQVTSLAGAGFFPGALLLVVLPVPAGPRPLIAARISVLIMDTSMVEY